MTQRQHLLRGNPAVCYDTYNSGHKKRHKTLCRIKPADFICKSSPGQEDTHGSQVGPPHRELEKVEDGQTCFNIHKHWRMKLPSVGTALFSLLDFGSGFVPTAAKLIVQKIYNICTECILGGIKWQIIVLM